MTYEKICIGIKLMKSTCRIHRSAECASLPRGIPRRSKSGCDFAMNAFGCIIRIKLRSQRSSRSDFRYTQFMRVWMGFIDV